MKRFGDYLINMGLNLALSWKWLVVAVIALVLHFVASVPLWVAGAIVVVWVVLTMLETAGLRFIGRIPTKQPKQENKCPYSRSNDEFPPLKK